MVVVKQRKDVKEIKYLMVKIAYVNMAMSETVTTVKKLIKIIIVLLTLILMELIVNAMKDITLITMLTAYLALLIIIGMDSSAELQSETVNQDSNGTIEERNAIILTLIANKTNIGMELIADVIKDSSIFKASAVRVLLGLFLTVFSAQKDKWTQDALILTHIGMETPVFAFLDFGNWAELA